MADVLGAFEQAVLLAVVRLRDEAYGRAILKDVQARLERNVAAGAVHATLGRLERKGLLSSRLGAGTPIRGGRARRFYRLEASRTTSGSGLGLALVKAVADLHGATIELTGNEPGLKVLVRFRSQQDDRQQPESARRPTATYSPAT